MGKVLGMRAERKREVVDEAAVREALTALNARIEMIQALIPLGLDAVHELLQGTVRDLSGHDLVVLFLDGKSFGDDEMVIAIGVTLTGTKVVLGMVQTASENTAVCRQFLKSLVERGLKFEQGLLCVIDGAKGFHGAVRA